MSGEPKLLAFVNSRKVTPADVFDKVQKLKFDKRAESDPTAVACFVLYTASRIFPWV